jgi:predicted dienelactone hydrolase
MRWYQFLLAAVFCCAATAIQAAGLQFIDVPADAEGAAIAGVVWSPCAVPAQEVMLRRLAVPGVKDCPIVGEKLPLVVISHGRTGWFGLHHDTAATLADAGFIVAAISHPGDNAFDPSRVDELSITIQRPADIKRLIDFMLGAWPNAGKIDPARIGFYGFSRGGYTGLVAIGAIPYFHRAAARCADGKSSGACELFQKNETLPDRIPHDPRIKAAVVADPGFGFLFGPDGLKSVNAPVQLWASALGGAGTSLKDNESIRDRLPAPPDYRVVPKAGHWAFMAPCSIEQTQLSPRSCVDATDFDRAAFHREFNTEVLAFLRKHLVPSKP